MRIAKEFFFLKLSGTTIFPNLIEPSVLAVVTKYH